MISSQGDAMVGLPALSYSSGGTGHMQFSTQSYDYAFLDIGFGVLATNGGIPSVLKISEADDTTSNITAVVALTGGTVVDASHGFIITPATALGGSVIELQIDLRKRKKYLTLDITNGTSTLIIDAKCRLTRAEQSADTAAAKSIANLFDTTFTVSAVVQA